MDSLTDPAISRRRPFGRTVYCLILNFLYESLIAAGAKYATVRTILQCQFKLCLPVPLLDSIM